MEAVAVAAPLLLLLLMMMFVCVGNGVPVQDDCVVEVVGGGLEEHGELFVRQSVASVVARRHTQSIQ